jgi:uncharacterized protein YodC (DUF2158 family)
MVTFGWIMEIGTKVRLKTGGPVMTVTKSTATGYLGCTWYEAVLKRERMFFPELVVVVEEEPPPVKPVTNG